MSNEIEIPEFSLYEYESSSKPYEWLYAKKNDKFLLKQLTQRMHKLAGAVGYKGFVSTFNAYCESMAAQRGETLERATSFNDQPIELITGDYICDERGVRMLDKFGYESVVCPHPIMPIRRLTNVDFGDERMELAYRKGNSWRTIVVEKSVLSSNSKILDLAAFGVVVNSENAKALSTYLFAMEQLNYDKIPEKRSVGRLGWIGNHGFSPYLEELEFDGEMSYRHIFQSVETKGSYETWVDAMRKVRAEKSVGRIVLAASFASAILQPCGLLPFFVHLWGGTETGKTVALMIAASVWANPGVGNFVTTFNSTQVGMEMTASFLNSMPMCVDELQIQSSAGVKDFDKIIYQLTEGTGKTRGSKHGGLQKQNVWKNCIITNGEHPISNSNSGGGAVNRIIEVETTEKVYSDLVGICDVLRENYGFAGKEFVEYIKSPDVEVRVSELQRNYFRKLLQIDSTDKQAGSASAILAADEIATELIFKDGNAISVDEISQFLAKKDDVNVNKRALEYVYEMIARNPSHFEPNEYGEYKSEVWGKFYQGYAYIVKSVFDREMTLGGYNSASFLSWADRNGHLVSDIDKKRRTKRARINGNLLHTVCIRLPTDDPPVFKEEIGQIVDGLPL